MISSSSLLVYGRAPDSSAPRNNSAAESRINRVLKRVRVDVNGSAQSIIPDEEILSLLKCVTLGCLEQLFTVQNTRDADYVILYRATKFRRVFYKRF